MTSRRRRFLKLGFALGLAGALVGGVLLMTTRRGRQIVSLVVANFGPPPTIRARHLGEAEPDRVWIAPGRFMMGSEIDSDNERPAHSVHVDGFFMDKTEATNAQYAACVSNGACTDPASRSSATRVSYYGNEAYRGYPVIHVNWLQARDFCAWAGKRLPTEAEWEKAAHGDHGGTGGRTILPLDCATSNFSGCVGDTTKVGSYQAPTDGYGVLDLEGNVNEWTSDWYGAGYYQVAPDVNPRGPRWGLHKATRGGSRSNTWDPANRHRDFVGRDTDMLGIRCASDAEL